MFLPLQSEGVLWETLKNTYHTTSASYSVGIMQQNNRCILYDSHFFLQTAIVKKTSHSLLLLWNGQKLLGCLNILYNII